MEDRLAAPLEECGIDIGGVHETEPLGESGSHAPDAAADLDHREFVRGALGEAKIFRYRRTSSSPPEVNDCSDTSPVLLSNTQPVLRTASSAVSDSVRSPALRHGTPCGRRSRSTMRDSKLIDYLRSGSGAEYSPPLSRPNAVCSACTAFCIIGARTTTDTRMVEVEIISMFT